MTDQDYEQKKRECWEEIWAPYREEVFMSDYGNDILVIADKVFKTAFDRAYALDKTDGAKEQKERDDHYIEMQKVFARFDKACDGTIHALDKLVNTLDKLVNILDKL